MPDFNKTVKWLSVNAPVTVRNDIRNLLKAISENAIYTINNINAIENIEKNINSPENIKAIIHKFNKDYISFCNKLEELNIMEIKIDDDITEMLNSIIEE